MRKIGLFGGTFDPPHLGHLNLAIQLKEKGNLDEVWVIPAGKSPLRTAEASANAEQRLAMSQLAFEEIPGFSVLDIEIKREGPSYTIETVKEILETYPSDSFHLLLGEDLLAQIEEWKDIKTLFEKIPFLIGLRPGSSCPPDAFKKECIEIARMEISATEIRSRLEKKLYCGHLLSGKVLDFIYQNQLYFNA